MVRAQPQSGLAHCPQVSGHVVGIPAARQEAGPSFRGINAAQSLGLLGFARVVCEGGGYFTVFEGVRVCLCMYVPVRCMCPCVSFPEVVWGTPVPVGISAAAACQLLPPRRHKDTFVCKRHARVYAVARSWCARTLAYVGARRREGHLGRCSRAHTKLPT